MLKNNTARTLAAYALVFLGFLLMFIFLLPSCDVFVFNHGTDGSLASAVDYSMNYGNGRFLGNFLAVVFSHSFVFAGIFEAIILSVLVISLNILLFNNKPITVIPLAIFITIPCSGIISECYYMFCAFLNYVVPVVLAAVCLVIMRRIYKGKLSKIAQFGLNFLLFVLTFAACLFSENSTILLAALAVLICISDILKDKKLHISSVLFFAAIILGGIVMMAIPMVTQTAFKMDSYRSISTTIPALLDTIVGNFVAFTTFFATFIPLVVLLSVALIFTAKKNCDNKKLCNGLIFVFISYAVSCIVFSFVDTNPRRLNWIYLLHAAMFCIYLIAMAITVLSIKDKAVKKKSIVLAVVIVVSVAPMMLVNQYGYRTFYTTFIAAFVFTVFLLKRYMPQAAVQFIKENASAQKMLSLICGVVFGFTSLFLLTQTLYNFAFYSVRAEDILTQLETSDTVEVPILPNYICSMEDEYFNIVSQSIGISLENVQLIDLYTSDNQDAYIFITQSPPTTIIRTVLENLDCFDPAYFIDRR